MMQLTLQPHKFSYWDKLPVWYIIRAQEKNRKWERDSKNTLLLPSNLTVERVLN